MMASQTPIKQANRIMQWLVFIEPTQSSQIYLLPRERAMEKHGQSLVSQILFMDRASYQPQRSFNAVNLHL